MYRKRNFSKSFQSLTGLAMAFLFTVISILLPVCTVSASQAEVQGPAAPADQSQSTSTQTVEIQGPAVQNTQAQTTPAQTLEIQGPAAQTTQVQATPAQTLEIQGPAAPNTQTSDEQANDSQSLPSVTPTPAAPKHIIGIDPGHQGPNVDMSAQEPLGPGSSETKAKATSGTQGSFTGLPEYQLNLDVSLKLQKILEKRGYKVILARTDNDTAISNKERAEYVASMGAEIYVRIHANGSDSSSTAGALTISPSSSNPYVANLYEDSNRLSQCIVDSYCEATGFDNLGVNYYDNMTGINWSTVPVTIVEMGFMTNEHDDRHMSDPDFQTIMANGIADGIDAYFGDEEDTQATDATSAEAEETGTISPSHGDSTFADNSDETLNAVLAKVQEQLPSGNGSWSAYICDLSTGADGTFNNTSMQAASLIKLYIMGAVYENYDSLSQQYGADTLNSLLTSMITVSDNDAANTLTTYLGGGDSSAGMQKVNSFCQAHGYTNTSMGRLLLASKEFGDNYTSAYDCGKFLKEIYQICAGTTQTPSLSHATDMYALLKQQQRTNKIPAAMPEGVHVANKTGELGDVENDAGIVYDTAQGKDLVICFMSENLSEAGSAQNTIAQLSRFIYDSYNS